MPRYALALINIAVAGVGLAAVAVLAGLTVLAPFFHYSTYVVLSGSMAPSIQVGSVVVVRATPPEELKIGDVITFVRAGDQENVTHRIVAIEDTVDGPSFTTRGDANNVADTAEIRYNAMAGKVAASLPFVGYVLKWVSSPAARLLLIVVPGVLLAGIWLWEIWQPALDRWSRSRTEATRPEASPPARPSAQSPEDAPFPSIRR